MRIKELKNIIDKKDYIFFDVVYYPNWFNDNTKTRKAFFKKWKRIIGSSYWLDTGETITTKDNINAMLRKEDINLKLQ